MKRFITPVIALLLFFYANYTAAQALVVNIGNKTASIGQQVCVPITVASGFNSLVGIQTSIRYDPTSLQPASIQNVNLTGLALNNNSIVLPGVNGNTPPGNIAVLWIANDVQNGLTLPNNTVLFEICFTVLNTASATTPITFGTTSPPTEASNSQGNEVTFNGQPGTVTVPDGNGSPPNPTPFKITASNKTVTRGEQVCLDFTVDGFTDLGSMQFSLQFDTTKVRFASVTGLNLSGLTNASFGLPGTGGRSAARLTLNYTKPGTPGVSVNNGTNIFQVCFTTVGTGTALVSFVNNPVVPQVLKANGTPVDFVSQNGNITINAPVVTPFKITANNKTVTQGQQVCVEFAVDGFTNLGGMQFSLQYDSTKLRFVSAGGFNLAGLTLSSFGLPGSGGRPAGRLTVNWTKTSTAGVTLPNGTTIFQLCFTALTPGPTTVSFANAPVTQQVTDGAGAVAPFTSQNGIVTINPPTPFKITASNKTVTQGEQVCVDFTVDGFTDIASMQFSLQYDTTKLRFVSAGGFGLNGLALSSFGLPGSGGRPAGRITVTWTKPGTPTITLPNGTSIFQLCFTAVSAGTGTVNFTATPVTQQVTNGTGGQVTFSSQNSTVTINPPVGTTPFKLSLSDKTATTGSTVCLDVTAEGFNNIVSMQFNLQYDPAKLEFASVGNFNLNSLIEEMFGRPGVGDVPQGRLSVSWINSATSGVSIANGTSIFQVCFKIKATSGSTTVSFTSVPNGIEVVNGNFEIIPFNSKNGTVTVGTGPVDPGPGGFRISLSDKTALSGEQICLDATVSGFKGIVGMQFSLNYDSTRLRFDTITNINLQYLIRSRIGTPRGLEPTRKGQISVSWEDETFNGLTVADNTIIFKICFTVLASNGTTTSVNFTNTPTTIEISDSTLRPISYTSKNGAITVGDVVDVLTIAESTLTNINCFGQTNGAINITTRNGVTPLTYLWSNGATTQNLTNVAAGSYSVTITDAAGKTATGGPYTITQPAAVLAFTPTVTNATCTNPNSGGISIAVTGGTAPYQYNWNGSLPDNVPSQTNLPAGSYSVTITDAKGCTLASNSISVSSGSTLAVPSITPVTASQGNNGAVSITVTGGTAPYAYAWTGPSPFTSTQKDLTGLSAGEYCVTVTDAQGCKATPTTCAKVTAPLIVTIQSTRLCEGATNGSATVTVTGGISPYTFRWNNGATTQNLTNVGAGTYIVTITDTQGSNNVSNTEVTSFPAIFVNAAVVGADPNIANGSIVATTTGGTGPYTFRWNNNATTDTLRNLAAGSYIVTVTDSRGCTKEATFIVPIIAVPISIGNRTITNVNCNGGNNGAYTFQILGGQGPFIVTYTGGTSFTMSTSTTTISNLTARQVIVNVTDNTGKIITDTVEITQPAPMVLSNIAVVHDSEEPGCTGKISATVSGGKAPYLIQWNSPNTGAQIVNLCEENYIPTVRDSSGCTNTFPAIALNTFRVSSSAIDAACPQDSNGVIALLPTGGTEPYTFSWQNGAGVVVSTNDTLIRAAPGVYTVRIGEQSGNTLIRRITLAASSRLDANVNVISDFNGSDVSCPNAKDAIIEAIVRNGNGTYRYEWRRDTAILSNASVLTNVGVGNYRVFITDSIGCRVAKEVQVVASDSIRIEASVRDVSCGSNRDGEIIVAATGGATTRPYTFRWNTNATTARLSFLAPGTYQVTATDGNNCTATRAFTLAQAKPIQVTVETQPATGECNGAAFANVEGGTAPYTYRWNSPLSPTDGTIDSLCPGTYAVLVTDSRGCSAAMAAGVVEDKRFPCAEVRAVISLNEGGGDGANDDFRITCIQDLDDNHLEIFNRWGQLIYQADDYDNSWKGTAQNGDLLPAGPYYYVLEYKDANGKLVQSKGSISILREK